MNLFKKGSMDIKNIKEWNNQVENYLKTIGEYSQIYALLHKKSQKKYNMVAYCIDIPTIVISTLVGTLSIGSQSLFSNNENANIGIGVLSLCSSVLQTINSYFSFNKRSENHRICSNQYQRIFLKIDLILSLHRHERPSITDFIKHITDEFNRLSEISPILDKELIDEFKQKYSQYKNIVQFPYECNGLSPIEITTTKTTSTTTNTTNTPREDENINIRIDCINQEEV